MRRLGILFIGLLLVSAGSVLLPKGRGDISCGSEIISDAFLTQDLVGCPADGVVIGADGIVLDCKGHKIGGVENTTYPLSQFSGIYISDRDNVRIQNCVVDGFVNAGIRLERTSRAELVNDTLLNVPETGIDMKSVTQIIVTNVTVSSNAPLSLPYGCGCGLSIEGGHGVSISRFNFTGRQGITIDADNVTVSDSYIHATFGFEIFGSNVTVVRNEIFLGDSGGGLGVEVNTSSKYITIGYNDISMSRNGAAGINIDSNDYPNVPRNISIVGNNISGGGSGISLFFPWNPEHIYPSNIIVIENRILGSHLGIRISIVFDGCGWCFIYHNSFVNNDAQAVAPNYPLGISWDNGHEGNYWSDYNGTDTDRDGIGDTPYVMNDFQIDDYPLMTPFGPESHNVAMIDVGASPVAVVVGGTVSVTVEVQDRGFFPENFTVTIYYNDTYIIDVESVKELAPGAFMTLSFAWNTTAVAPGTYPVKATVSAVPDETNLVDNTATSKSHVTVLDDNIDSIARHYARSREYYRVLDVNLWDNPFSVVIYYPMDKPQNWRNPSGAIVFDPSNRALVMQSDDPTQNFVVNGSLTLALGKVWGIGAEDPAFWARLSGTAGLAYDTLVIEYALVQALWILVDYETGLHADDLAVRVTDITNFVLSQVETLNKLNGDANGDNGEIHEAVNYLDKVKKVADGVRSLKDLSAAYKSDKVISEEDDRSLAKSKADVETASFLIQTVVDYTFTDDIEGMATSWLEVGAYTKALEGISTRLQAILNETIHGALTAPEVDEYFAYRIGYARFGVRTWAVLANLYQNLVNKGTLDVWYWLTDASNSQKSYENLRNTWLTDVLQPYETEQKDFYDTLDRLFKNSVDRILSQDPSILMGGVHASVKIPLTTPTVFLPPFPILTCATGRRKRKSD